MSTMIAAAALVVSFCSLLRSAPMQDKVKTRTGAASRPPEDLPYRIELWRADADELKRVLARAVTVQLARAIFKAAQGEHPQRRITLCKGNRVVSDSNG
jgi:hypothetical protein